jgi:hypothetical protein
MPNEFENNIVSLWFYHKNDAVRGLRIKGVSFAHGQLIGQSMVGKMSIDLGKPVWLGYITDGENSRVFPAPVSIIPDKIEMLFPSDGTPSF